MVIKINTNKSMYSIKQAIKKVLCSCNVVASVGINIASTGNSSMVFVGKQIIIKPDIKMNNIQFTILAECFIQALKSNETTVYINVKDYNGVLFLWPWYHKNFMFTFPKVKV